MHAYELDGRRRDAPGRWRGFIRVLLALVVTLVPTAVVFAHGIDYRIEHGDAVMVHFSSHHDGPMAGAGFRVFAPPGREVFASGNTDALGRAVFVPDRPGNWRVLMATDDGHGAEVEVPVEAGPTAASSRADRDPPVATAGRIPATAAGVGYLFGLAGLLALWRLRR